MTEEGFSGSIDPNWIEIGFIAAEPGGLLLIAIILSHGDRRPQDAAGRRRAEHPGAGRSRALTTIAPPRTWSPSGP